MKFFEPIFNAPLENLPQAVDFKGQLPAALALKISYDAEQRLLALTPGGYTGLASRLVDHLA